MAKPKKILTDNDVKRKAVKLVLAHLKRKVAGGFIGSDNVNEWLAGAEELLENPEFNLVEYHEKRNELNDIIERIPDEEMRFKVRDSWYSLGRALDKKAKRTMV